ncbi:class F sortase [Amycolatopsis sp. WAC 04182]|uniref:class F sortase n=1 Tax=Amycolatopsis sp. WAC 04182 TaxID=2203198 RepID=UPI000F79677B|nr:class F sortase [Amycolatopsis sp. WAC 04182]RSN57236.1 class F sortase [Amycolatopsis sp. WAC 04182]
MTRRVSLVLAVVLAAVVAFVLSGQDEVAPPRAPERAAEAVTRGLPKADPVSIDVPKIEARSSLIPLGLNADDTIEVPPVTRPMQAGWYLHGPTPGEVGPSVILGHVDGNKQKGIFFRLKELVPGDKVSITRKDGVTAEFAVTKVERVAKDEFPTDAVYGDTAEPELRLITCGGVFDKASRNYLDNVIVFARMISSP